MTFTRTERLSLVALLVTFTWFTWRGITLFYTGDDMMNTVFAWNVKPWRLALAQLLVWIPVYRPLGAAIYILFYKFFGFHPAPLYTLCWLLLAGNVIFAYRFFRTLTPAPAQALTALGLILVHGCLSDLYLSAGTLYDRLCFLFTVTGLVAYFRFRTKSSWRSFTLVCLLAVLCMDSKESGVALTPLLFCCECIYFLPNVWKTQGSRARFLQTWLRQIGPLFITLAAISLLFVLGRVKRTPELVQTPTYHPQADMSVWLSHVAEYFTMLTYRHAIFGPTSVCFLLAGMAAVALFFRNRAMLFGWLFFVITITPVALIASRPGYVLYVPDLGLGLFFAAAIALPVAPLERALPGAAMASFLLVTVAITWFHIRNWPATNRGEPSPESRLSQQFRRDYPALPRAAKLLFVSDDYLKESYDLAFNLRLLYHDKWIVANRLQAPPDQQPDFHQPLNYAYIFALESGRYQVLDPRDPRESIRLNILRDYTVGRVMDISRRDHSAYVVSGLKDGDEAGPSRWTEPHAEFKFDLYPAPAIFSARFWLPDFVSRPGNRTLSFLVGGKPVGAVPLVKPGWNEIQFPVPADCITANAYTLVDLNVANPYQAPNGEQFGVVLLSAGFEYAGPRKVVPIFPRARPAPPPSTPLSSVPARSH